MSASTNTDFTLAIEDLTVSFDGFKAVDALPFYLEKNALPPHPKLPAGNNLFGLPLIGNENLQREGRVS